MADTNIPSVEAVDAAAIALTQARGILDVLTVACKGLEIEGTYNGSLVQSIYTAMSEVDRAREVLFGKQEVAHG
jgi:hypothetical protein